MKTRCCDSIDSRVIPFPRINVYQKHHFDFHNDIPRISLYSTLRLLTHITNAIRTIAYA